jgi:hypothetical protein
VPHRRGYELCQYEDEPEFLWPRCEITGCPNNVCLGMSESLCYPHGIEFGSFTEEQFEEDRRKRNLVSPTNCGEIK